MCSSTEVTCRTLRPAGRRRRVLVLCCYIITSTVIHLNLMRRLITPTTRTGVIGTRAQHSVQSGEHQTGEQRLRVPSSRNHTRERVVQPETRAELVQSQRTDFPILPSSCSINYYNSIITFIKCFYWKSLQKTLRNHCSSVFRKKFPVIFPGILGTDLESLRY